MESQRWNLVLNNKNFVKYVVFIVINNLIFAIFFASDQLINYSLVLEYADSGTLKSYLKESFNELEWDDKYPTEKDEEKRIPVPGNYNLFWTKIIFFSLFY